MAPKTPAKAIKKVADKQKASASEKKKKSLIKVKATNNPIMGRKYYNDMYRSFIKDGMSPRAAASKVKEEAILDIELELKEFNFQEN